MRRRILPSLTLARLGVAGVAVPVAAFAIGVNWLQSLLIAGALIAAVAAVELYLLAEEPYWPQLDEARRAGGRREVTSLSWMLTPRRHGTDRQAVVRLREIARRRLALHGIDLENPEDRARAVEALGPLAVGVLTDNTDDGPSHRALVRCIESLERLEAPRQTASVRRTSPAGTPSP